MTCVDLQSSATCGQQNTLFQSSANNYCHQRRLCRLCPSVRVCRVSVDTCSLPSSSHRATLTVFVVTHRKNSLWVLDGKQYDKACRVGTLGLSPTGTCDPTRCAPAAAGPKARFPKHVHLEWHLEQTVSTSGGMSAVEEEDMEEEEELRIASSSLTTSVVEGGRPDISCFLPPAKTVGELVCVGCLQTYVTTKDRRGVRGADVYHEIWEPPCRQPGGADG